MLHLDPIQHRAHRPNFSLSDQLRAFNVHDDTVVGIDQVVGRITEECRAFTRCGPLACGIRMGRELGFDLRCGPECRIVQDVEIFLHSTRRIVWVNGTVVPILFLVWSFACSHRLQLDWRLPQDVAHSPSHPRCTAQRSSRTDDAIVCFPESARVGSWKRLNGLGSDQTNRGGRTNDMQGSNAPLRKDGAQSGCQNNSPPAACGTKVPDRWMADLCGYKTQLDIAGRRLDRRTDQWSAADDLAGHDHQSRTRKTMRFVLLALVLTSKLSPVAKDN